MRPHDQSLIFLTHWNIALALLIYKCLSIFDFFFMYSENHIHDIKYRKILCWYSNMSFIIVIVILLLAQGSLVYCTSVAKRSCEVWLLTAQKPINRLGWWKGKFALFQMWATWGGRADICPKATTQAPALATSGARAFIAWGGWEAGDVLHAETAQSAFGWGQVSELWQLMSWVCSGASRS